jgi:microcystin-dependent protein
MKADGTVFSTAISALTEDTSPDSTADFVMSYDDSASALKKVLIATLIGSLLPAGVVSAYGGTDAPTGWLLCYGQAVDRTTYANLFTAIGTTYGVGDGETTFNLPDLRGRVVAGQDDMGGSSANRLTGVTGSVNGDTLGGTGGEEAHTLTGDELPADVPRGGATIASENWSPSGPSAYVPVSSTDAWSGGAGGAHNNVQPTIVLNYIIKT